MNLELSSYGELIAVRYRDCADPLVKNVSEWIGSSGISNKLSQNDLALIADHVSLGRELNHNERDTYGCLDEKSVPKNQGAVVDELLAGTMAPCSDRRFSVFITHDMDRTTLCECTAIAKLFKRVRFRTLRDVFNSLSVCGSVIARTVDKLLRFEVDNNIRSIFFFLSGPYSFARYGSRTSARWSSAQNIIRSVKAAGMEIGLHGSYYAADKGSYADECRRLSDAAQVTIRHHRSHYLRYDPKNFWRQLSKAGIQYDHSIGFSTGWGLRAGTCMPYPVYDLSAQMLSNIIEIPMVLMDGALAFQFNHADRNNVRALLETVRKHRGCVGINFHPEALATQRADWDCYTQVIDICRELGADMMPTSKQ